jgi:hypothetical protein
MKTNIAPILLAALCIALIPDSAASLSTDTAAGIYTRFRNPPARYRSITFWVWNNRITEAEIDEQLKDFKDHGIGGVFIHPRPGLITPYLSGEWLSRCAYAVKTGKSLGMEVWLYDENSYPSGFAGGNVPALLPDAGGTGLRMTRVQQLPNPIPEGTILTLMKQGQDFVDITRTAGSHLSLGDYRLFSIQRNGPSPWYGGYTYVDIMRREVTDKFLEVTIGAYERSFGAEFGKTVPGIFQDEAHIAPVGGKDVIQYTPALFDAFRAKWGYDLRTSLPSLTEETGDWKRIRHHYYATLLDLFIANWAKPYYSACEQRGLAFTGHYWEHEWPNPRIGPDNLAMAAYAHVPGVDILMNEWATGPRAQFGNARAVKEIRSAANQLGRERTLSETYGAGGWDLTFFDQKRIGDWEYVLGVNLLNQHLSYVTIMGARKRDHPQSFSYHEPWWRAYSLLGDYFGRLTSVMAAGKQENRILVIEPTTSAWMYASPNGNNPRLDAIGNEFQDFVNRLEKRQIEYDLGSEDTLRDHGTAAGKSLRVGECRYDLVILPPGMENLDSSTYNLLSKYLAAEGNILAWTMPSCVDGAPDDRPAKLAGRYPETWRTLKPGSNPAEIDRLIPPPLRFENPDAIAGVLFHHTRTLRDARLVFLANSSDTDFAKGSFTAAAGSVERWDPFTGGKAPYPSTLSGKQRRIGFDLPPGGSLLLCLSPAAGPAVREPMFTESVLPPSDQLAIRRESPNVLTLDYCDLTLGGKTERDLYFYEAQQRTFKQHGLDRNPWDSAVQFKTNILDKDTFPADSGFEAAFRFTVSPGVNLASLRAVIERPDLYTVSLNGKTLTRTAGQWWLDRNFGVFALGSAAREGENTLTLKAAPFTIHTELESVYLLGDFRVQSRDKGFALIPDASLAPGAWNDQGMPFYAEGVRYSHTFALPQAGGKSVRYTVELPAWKGSFAEVFVNGKSAGYIAFRPPSLDITGMVKPGENRIEVVVYGTLKNTLGPHHNNPPLGRAWPGMFQAGAKGGRPAGSAYSTVGYGLLYDFQVKEGTAQ